MPLKHVETKPGLPYDLRLLLRGLFVILTHHSKHLSRRPGTFYTRRSYGRWHLFAAAHLALEVTGHRCNSDSISSIFFNIKNCLIPL